MHVLSGTLDNTSQQTCVIFKYTVYRTLMYMFAYISTCVYAYNRSLRDIWLGGYRLDGNANGWCVFDPFSLIGYISMLLIQGNSFLLQGD